MKNVFKAFGIIALAALIAFSMAACPDSGGGPDGGGGSGGGSGGGGNSGNWPPNSVLSQYGISGMPAPTGATNIVWMTDRSSLYISFAGTPATDAAALRWLENNGWTLEGESYDSKMYDKESFSASYAWDQDNSDGRSRALLVTHYS